MSSPLVGSVSSPDRAPHPDPEPPTPPRVRPEVLTAIVTPFDPSGALDLGAVDALVDHVAPSVDGLFVGGTTGEFPALEPDERLDLTTRVLTRIGPDRTVAHVGAASTRQAEALVRPLLAAGVTRFAALTPYYLTASVAGTRRHLGHLVDLVGDRGEVYVYVFPDVAGTDVEPAALATLTEDGAAGVKVSGRACARVADYLAAVRPGFRLWSGNDADLPRVSALGGTGTVSGVSGVAPGPFAALAGTLHDDPAGAGEAAARVDALVAALGPSITRLKHGLDLLGLPGGATRMPIDPPDAATRDRIRTVLADAGLLP